MVFFFGADVDEKNVLNSTIKRKNAVLVPLLFSWVLSFSFNIKISVLEKYDITILLKVFPIFFSNFGLLRRFSWGWYSTTSYKGTKKRYIEKQRF